MDSDKRQDESELIAASALDDMRKGAQQPASSSQAATVAYSEGFVGRVTGIPLVNSALRVYEQGKASSRVVKYGAQMVESGVKSISKPVINRLPVDVNQLDEFACRQLDRLDRYRRPSINEKTPTSPQPPTSPSATSTSAHTETLVSPTSPQTSSSRGRPAGGKGKSPEVEEDPVATIKEKPKRRGSSWLNAARSPFTGPASPSEDKKDAKEPNQTSNDERQVVQRSRWQTMLLEAGGLSAALSEESMRRLKYCLEWLLFATSHIDGQILVLRDFIASLQPLPPGQERPNGRPPVSPQHLKTLAAARRDIVHTVRQVVEVVSRYAGGALPEPARSHVRGFILQLPQRWAKKSKPGAGPGGGRDVDVELDRLGSAGDKELGKEKERERESVAAAATGGGAVRRGRRAAGHRERGAGGASNPPSRASSPVGRHAHARHHSGQYQHGGDGEVGPGPNGEAVSATAAIVAAQKILTLATESLDMMRGVTGVVKDSLDKADAWVGRLRAVGIERGRSGQQEDETTEPMSPRSPASPGSPHSSSTTTSFRTHRHTRNISDLSELDELDITHSLHRRRRAGSIDSDMDIPASPFYSSSLNSFSSSNGSSIPSTPGASFILPPGHQHQGVYYAAGQSTGAVHAHSNLAGPGMYTAAASPGANQLGLGLKGMTLDSRGGSVTSTPRSVVRDLQEHDEEDEVRDVKIDRPQNLKEVRSGEPKVVGMEVEVGDDGETMDVDS